MKKRTKKGSGGKSSKRVTPSLNPAAESLRKRGKAIMPDKTKYDRKRNKDD